MGSTEINLDGAMVTLSPAISMGFNWCHADGSCGWRARPMDAPWPVEWQTGYTHEVLHLLGAGYHSNMLQCLNPGVDQRDVLSCANAEYTDYYDLLGSSNGWAPNLNARSRYHFGWLGADDVIAIRYRGTHAIAPLNSDPAAAGIRAACGGDPVAGPVARVADGGAGDGHGADGGGVFDRNDGLFVRRHNTMIDADLQSCDPLTEEQWKGEDELGESDGESGEIGRVTLRADRTLVLRTVGTLIQNTGVDDPDASIPKMEFAVHFTGEAPPCERAVPRIATGLFGEWQFLDGSREEWSYDATISRCCRTATPAARRTRPTASRTTTPSAVARTTSPITLALGATDIAPLPSGWSFVAQPTAIAPGGYNSIGFGFGIADDAADGDYDFCMVASTSSGMRSAKLFRLTLPESELNWYTNNRPSPSGGSSTYAGADPALVAACAALSGCDPSVEGCVEPRTDTCDLNLPCDSGAFDTEWGRCWADGSGGGVRMRGRDSLRRRAVVLRGGLPLLESEACADPIDPPADQARRGAAASIPPSGRRFSRRAVRARGARGAIAARERRRGIRRAVL